VQGTNQVIYKRRVTSKDFDKTDHRTALGKGSYEEIRITDLPDIQDELLREIDKIFPFGFKGHWETGNHIETLAHHYIIRKIIKIAVTYPFYYQYFDQDEKKFKDGKLRGYLDLIFKKNENHISVKLKQTLNFLKYRHIDVYSHKPFELDVREFARKVEEVIKQNKLRGEDAIELLPPPIFSRRIILRSVSERGKEIEFYKLSSGEKQLIFSVNTILYHLLNLDSIKNHRFQKGYRSVNIMLDEIELYFHPDRQKEYVSFLLRRIGEVKFKTIQAINICFVTHSPFILSDIPSANILFLEENGVPKVDAVLSRTFGANIHDLLKNNFFLLNGSIGNFAREKINDTINFLNHQKVLKEIN
ncbi:MAG: hypothetical protein EOO46_24975, partial [Flavobacterium sp.]